MPSHALLSLITSKDLSLPAYVPGNQRNIHEAAKRCAERLQIDLRTIGVKHIGELETGLDTLRQARYGVLDAHGSDGTICFLTQWVHPSQLSLRDSELQLLFVNSCHQNEDTWASNVPPGCRVIGHKGSLKAGSYKSVARNAARVHELIDLPDGNLGASAVADWVLNHALGGTKRLHDWFITTGT